MERRDQQRCCCIWMLLMFVCFCWPVYQNKTWQYTKLIMHWPLYQAYNLPQPPPPTHFMPYLQIFWYHILVITLWIKDFDIDVDVFLVSSINFIKTRVHVPHNVKACPASRPTTPAGNFDIMLLLPFLDIIFKRCFYPPTTLKYTFMSYSCHHSVILFDPCKGSCPP